MGKISATSLSVTEYNELDKIIRLYDRYGLCYPDEFKPCKKKRGSLWWKHYNMENQAYTLENMRKVSKLLRMSRCSNPISPFAYIAAKVMDRLGLLLIKYENKRWCSLTKPRALRYIIIFENFKAACEWGQHQLTPSSLQNVIARFLLFKELGNNRSLYFYKAGNKNRFFNAFSSICNNIKADLQEKVIDFVTSGFGDKISLLINVNRTMQYYLLSWITSDAFFTDNVEKSDKEEQKHDDEQENEENNGTKVVSDKKIEHKKDNKNNEAVASYEKDFYYADTSQDVELAYVAKSEINNNKVKDNKSKDKDKLPNYIAIGCGYGEKRWKLFPPKNKKIRFPNLSQVIVKIGSIFHEQVTDIYARHIVNFDKATYDCIRVCCEDFQYCFTAAFKKFRDCGVIEKFGLDFCGKRYYPKQNPLVAAYYPKKEEGYEHLNKYRKFDKNYFTQREESLFKSKDNLNSKPHVWGSIASFLWAHSSDIINVLIGGYALHNDGSSLYNKLLGNSSSGIKTSILKAINKNTDPILLRFLVPLIELHGLYIELIVLCAELVAIKKLLQKYGDLSIRATQRGYVEELDDNNLSKEYNEINSMTFDDMSYEEKYEESYSELQDDELKFSKKFMEAGAREKRSIYKQSAAEDVKKVLKNLGTVFKKITKKMSDMRRYCQKNVDNWENELSSVNHIYHEFISGQGNGNSLVDKANNIIRQIEKQVSIINTGGDMVKVRNNLRTALRQNNDGAVSSILELVGLGKTEQDKKFLQSLGDKDRGIVNEFMEKRETKMHFIYEQFLEQC